MHTSAVILEGPRQLTLREIGLKDPTEGDVVVCVHHSGISTGTEKLLWSGSMPPFPGLGYPLVPGYEAVGEIVDAPKGSGHKIGDFGGFPVPESRSAKSMTSSTSWKAMPIFSPNFLAGGTRLSSPPDIRIPNSAASAMSDPVLSERTFR